METTNLKKIEYLQQLKNDLQNLSNAFSSLQKTWYDDYLADVNSNEILANEYPFDESFDHICAIVRNWKKETTIIINQNIEDLINLMLKI
jgi:uncharacterized protein YukE